MKVLITGGAGFIGSRLADFYLDQGCDVVIVDDLSSGTRENIRNAEKNGARFFELPIQSEALSKLIQSEDPSLINHHAAQKSVRDSVQNPIHDADINIKGLLRILEAARSSNCKHVIFASSGGVVYGEQTKHPADEGHQLNPLSPYGVSKLASEYYLNYYFQAFGINSVSLRYANVYGPRQDPYGEAGVVAIFLSQMIQGKETKIFGTGKQTRDFVYVDDIALANTLFDNRFSGCFRFNVGTGNETSILELHRMLAEITSYRKEALFCPAQMGEQIRSCLDSSALQSQFGWKPKTNLKEGLQQTHQWFFNQNQT